MRLLLFVALLMVASLVGGETQMIQKTPHKKIIEFGWDVPSPEFFQANLKAQAGDK